MELANWVKPVVVVCALALCWTWESIAPHFRNRQQRWRHAFRNALLAIINQLLLGLVFGTLNVAVLRWTELHSWGLFHQFSPGWWRWPAAILVLDGWLYLWHRLNHEVPVLWRFHRVHHADPEMDVTTATRFHTGELALSQFPRLLLLLLTGISLQELLLFETLVLCGTMFHHANISLGSWDRLLRFVLVSPSMHRVHHSQIREETNSNYSVLWTGWDRLAGTYHEPSPNDRPKLGLSGWEQDTWQTLYGMWRMPFQSDTPESDEPAPGMQANRADQPTSTGIPAG